MILVSFLSFLVGIIVFFPIRAIAFKRKIIDLPDGKLKIHSEAVPYLGGVIVFISFLAGVFLEIYILKYHLYAPIKGLLISSLFIIFLGIVDDMYQLHWEVKLFGEIILAVILISYNIRIDFIFFPTWLNILLTILWIVFITNAYNIIDVADGVSGFTFLIFLTLTSTISFITGNNFLPLLIYPLIGGTLAFLVFNLPKAKIFAGDCGSLFFGFLVGVITIHIKYTEFNRFAIITPYFMNFYIIFEVVLVVISRLKLGLSPFAGSAHHFPIRLKKVGLNDYSILSLIIGINLISSIIAILCVSLGGFIPLYLFIVGFIVMIIMIIIFLNVGKK